MPAFSYTSGNPDNLVSSGNASMGDIQGPFTDLRTFLNGGLGTSNLQAAAGILETQLASSGNGLAKGSFSVYRNAALSLASLTAIVFDTEEFDVSGWHDVTTGRYTPQVPGYYRFAWGAETNGALTADTHWQAILRKNGTLAKGGTRCFQRSTVGMASTGATAAIVANGSTDFFDIAVFHNNGGSPAIAVGTSSTFFTGGLAGRS